MDKFSVVLTKQKETKGTHVFANADEGLSIYIPKARITGNVPLKIKVTFEPETAAPASNAPESEM